MNKGEIIQILEDIALLLEFQGENPFKVRAYHNAAHTLLNMEEDLEKVIKDGTLTDYPGIGEHIAEKITILFKKGNLPYYNKLKKSVPEAVLKMTQVPGLGAKKIKTIYDKLKIKSIAELKKACQEGKIAKLRGFGTKTEQNILNSITNLESYGQRHLWWEAMQAATSILNNLRKLKGVKKAEIAGSLRRKLETVGDLDFLVASSNPTPIMDWFTTQKHVLQVIAKGKTKSSIRLPSGLQADLRIVSEEQFPFALCYFTGSKAHNIKIRARALKKGWSLSEWDLVSTEPRKKGPFTGSKKALTEEDIYQVLGLSYIPPELREEQGELEAAEKNKIPKLLEEKEIKGTFHNHTTASDGRSNLKELVQEAQNLGWEYIGISDHSKSSFQANGLSEESLLQQVQEIKKLNASKKFRTHIFAGSECDILPNGSLDYSNEVLKKLDYVVISVHSAFAQDEKTMTKRLIKAIENPYSTMVGHVTGRLLLQRPGYAVNIPKIIDACIANGKIMELNAQPKRLDMDWRFWHAASQKGLLCCINTDAHHKDQLQYFKAGVNIARKGWLQTKHVINTLSLKQIQKLLQDVKKN
jgi:DNA polymerase (family X)